MSEPAAQQPELCAICTPERDHNGVLCRRCANRELAELRIRYGAKFNAISEALGYATEAETWLVNDGVDGEGLRFLRAAIGALHDA